MIVAPRVVGPRKLPVRQGSPEWLAARREHVTATDIPVLLGISPWRCEQDIADEKLSGNGQESTLVMRVGSALEDLIADAYAVRLGRKVRRVRGLWESRTIPWAAASPDATAGGLLVELKWTGSRTRFRDGLPDDVAAQVQWQLMVAEAPVADVATLTVGEPEIRVFTVYADPDLQANFVAIAADFRRRLAEGGPFAQSLESLKRAHPADDGSELVADPDVTAALMALRAVRRQMDALKSNEEALKIAVQTRMADASVLTGEGYVDGVAVPFRVTWKRTKDATETDWKSLASGLLNAMPEPERAALVGLHSTVRPGFRPFRVAWGKEDAS
jgi:putative phage-type endonuclease